MSMYRIYFLGEDEHIRAVEEIGAEDGEEAVRRSLAILQQRPQHRAIEVWQEGRMIYLSSAVRAGDSAAAIDAALVRPVSDTAVFLRLAAIETRRLAERAPAIAAELCRIAEQSDAQAADLLAHLPPGLSAGLSRPEPAASAEP